MSCASVSNEFKCETLHMKMSCAAFSFSCNNQSHVHIKGFALRLALKQRHKETRRWPISCCSVLNFRARVACMAGSQRRRKNFARLVFALQAWKKQPNRALCFSLLNAVTQYGKCLYRISCGSSGGKKKTFSQKHFLECVIYLSSSIGWNKMRKASLQQYTANERYLNCCHSYSTVCFYLMLGYCQSEYFRTLLLLIM